MDVLAHPPCIDEARRLVSSVYMSQVTASILYDLVSCPTRPYLDAFGDPAKRDKVSPFVQLLWEKGSSHERQVIEGLEVPFLDLSKLQGAEKEAQTLEAMRRGEPLIYGGRISAGDLLGEPDLLRRETGGYVPGDIKAGSGEEAGGEDGEGKPKLHYAVQLALYPWMCSSNLVFRPVAEPSSGTSTAKKSTTTSPRHRGRRNLRPSGTSMRPLSLRPATFFIGDWKHLAPIAPTARCATGTQTAWSNWQRQTTSP